MALRVGTQISREKMRELALLYPNSTVQEVVELVRREKSLNCQFCDKMGDGHEEDCPQTIQLEDWRWGPF